MSELTPTPKQKNLVRELALVISAAAATAIVIITLFIVVGGLKLFGYKVFE